jgi:hypothetical protein
LSSGAYEIVGDANDELLVFSPLMPPRPSATLALDPAAGVVLAIASWPRESRSLEVAGKLVVANMLAEGGRARRQRERTTLGMRMSLKQLRLARVPYAAARPWMLGSVRTPRAVTPRRRTRTRAPARSSEPDEPEPPGGRQRASQRSGA